MVVPIAVIVEDTGVKTWWFSVPLGIALAGLLIYLSLYKGMDEMITTIWNNGVIILAIFAWGIIILYFLKSILGWIFSAIKYIINKFK